MEAEQSVVNNPVKMSKMMHQLQAELDAKAEKKRAKKEAKKAKKDAKKVRSAGRPFLVQRPSCCLKLLKTDREFWTYIEGQQGCVRYLRR